MLFSFSQFWQQSELSDVDVLLAAPAAQQQQQDVKDSLPQKLAAFPGHSVLLSSSPFIKAQIMRWQRKQLHVRPSAPLPMSSAVAQGCVGSGRQQQDAQGSSGADAAAGSSSAVPGGQSSRPQVVLTLQDASEQPAAMTILAALYGVKPVPELLSELPQQQLLQAALLADMWQLPAITAAAAGALADTLSAQGKLSEGVTLQLLRSQAVPDCLQPLVRQVLLSVLGNLEQCWADEGLQQVLMHLPLPTMELLLSCDELKVATEDTVLYTVQQCMGRAGDADTKQRIQEHLAPLIRSQHLSQYWLLLSVVSDDAASMPLAQLRPQLKKLLLMRTAQPKRSITPTELQDQLSGAPPSWVLGPRSYTPVSRVQLEWQLDVSTLRDAARRSAAQGNKQVLLSPGVTPPLGGLAFELKASCSPASNGAGTEIGMFVQPRVVPSDASYSFRCTLSARCEGAFAFFDEISSPVLPTAAGPGWGFGGFFTDPMAGGWDELAWAAEGLPSSGPLVIELSVVEVKHLA